MAAYSFFVDLEKSARIFKIPFVQLDWAVRPPGVEGWQVIE